MLTPRENFIRFMRREGWEWIPSTVDMKRIAPALVCDHVARGAVHQQQPYTGAPGGKDMLGVEWTYDSFNKGSMDTKPLLGDIDGLSDWEKRLTIPDAHALDWARCAEENREYLDTDKLVCTILYTNYFERLISLVGFEDAAVAMIDEDYTDAVKALFDRLTDYYIELLRCYHEKLNVDYVSFHDDWGHQRGTMFSVQTHREMILPYVSRFAAAAREMGVLVEQHSCGLIETLIPNIIESGVDTWRGQDVNDKQALVEKYGDCFTFGVVLDAPADGSEAAAEALMRKYLKMYEGRHVWFAFPGTFTDGQRERASAVLRGR